MLTALSHKDALVSSTAPNDMCLQTFTVQYMPSYALWYVWQEPEHVLALRTEYRSVALAYAGCNNEV